MCRNLGSRPRHRNSGGPKEPHFRAVFSRSRRDPTRRRGPRDRALHGPRDHDPSRGSDVVRERGRKGQHVLHAPSARGGAVKSTGGILVVDDDPDLREFLHLMLTSMGFEVTSAANGQEALDAMEGHDPDLILLDMKMPVMNGWEFCSALECRAARRPPIVVLPAAPDPAARA